MEAMLNIFVLNRLMVLFFVSALALAILGWKNDRGHNLAYAALIIGIFIATLSAWISWNGHDWIPDGDDLIRYSGAAAGAVAFGFLWVFPSEKPGKANAASS